KYLVQFITTLHERFPIPSAKQKDSGPSHSMIQPTPFVMCKKALQLFYDFLSPEYWGDLDIDLFPKVTETILTGEKADKPDDKFTTTIINTLQVLRIIVNFKSNEWIVSHLSNVQHLLEKPLRS